jgi:hypothetical protein
LVTENWGGHNPHLKQQQKQKAPNVTKLPNSELVQTEVTGKPTDLKSKERQAPFRKDGAQAYL